MKTKINIFTLTWNGFDKIEELKNSLLPSFKKINYTWFIKDNGSNDNTVEKIKEWKLPNVEVINYKNNLQNFSQGMNFLYNHSSPSDDDLILLLNNDVVCNDDKSISKMASYFLDDKVGVVGAKLLFKDSNLIQHVGVVFHPANKMPLHFKSKQKLSDEDFLDRKFQVVTGAVLMIKAGLYKNLNTNKSGNCGMDEEFNWAFDDVDLCLSAKYNFNKEILYSGSTNFYHEESSTLKKNPINKIFLKNNMRKLKSKWENSIVIDFEDYKLNKKYNLYKK